MKESIKSILLGIFFLILAGVWFFALDGWQLMLFRVIPLDNVIAAIIFAVIGVISLISAFIKKK